MKPFVAIAFALLLLTACREEKATANTETSPGGVAYTRLYLPKAQNVAVQILWPSDWTSREDVNQAVPYIGADLILAGGAEGYPAGQAGEVFADLKAEGSLWVTTDNLHGQLVAPKDKLTEAITISNAHLAKPLMDQMWFDRVQDGFATNMAANKVLPATQGFDALRWITLGDTPLRRAASIDPPEMISKATRADVQSWHQQTITRKGAKLVIAGQISADEAGRAVDALLKGLPEGQPMQATPTQADFPPKRILLHLPDAQTSTLVFLGQLPPTRDGGEFEDYFLVAKLGGGDDSVLFDAVRTGLRASYGYNATLDGYTRDVRFLALTGEVETAKLAEAETIVRAAYAEFLKSPPLGALSDWKGQVSENLLNTAKDPATESFSAMMAILDGQNPATVLTLATDLGTVSEATVTKRASSAFPAADEMIVLAVSPDAAALPGACVISTPAEAANCP